ncbi:MAG: hypothetical protein ABSG94_03200 [Brevinematales bacterium]
MGDYHGIIINRSQKNRSIFKEMDIIGKKNILGGIIVLYKVSVSENNLQDIIKKIRKNMSCRLLFKRQEFYAHFYRGNELIIVYKNKVFNAAVDQRTWKEAIEYGKSLGIIEKQLDFKPNRIEDETY